MGLPRLTSLLSCIGNSQEWQQACALVAAQSKGHLHPITWQLGMPARRNSALEILQCSADIQTWLRQLCGMSLLFTCTRSKKFQRILSEKRTHNRLWNLKGTIWHWKCQQSLRFWTVKAIVLRAHSRVGWSLKVRTPTVLKVIIWDIWIHLSHLESVCVFGPNTPMHKLCNCNRSSFSVLSLSGTVLSMLCHWDGNGNQPWMLSLHPVVLVVLGRWWIPPASIRWFGQLMQCLTGNWQLVYWERLGVMAGRILTFRAFSRERERKKERKQGRKEGRKNELEEYTLIINFI